jgi:hypothetical protein
LNAAVVSAGTYYNYYTESRQEVEKGSTGNYYFFYIESRQDVER